MADHDWGTNSDQLEEPGTASPSWGGGPHTVVLDAYDGDDIEASRDSVVRPGNPEIGPVHPSMDTTMVDPSRTTSGLPTRSTCGSWRTTSGTSGPGRLFRRRSFTKSPAGSR